MKERPILFSGPMVRAILEGRKTMTRRVVTWRGKLSNADEYTAEDGDGVLHDTTDFCPYGVPGDRLWVRETFGFPEQNEEEGIVYRATDPTWDEASTRHCKTIIWKPSIFMPRWASRITLDVTGVRVERLNAISEGDAISEGVENIATNEWRDYRDGGKIICSCGSFRSLWESINGRGSWAANPWVWVVEFKRVDKTP